MELSYKGTLYNGWQIQPNAPSVQQTLEKALSVLLKEEVSVTGAGRTDTGVHARFYVAHFDTATAKDPADEDFRYHLNAMLPRDIAVSKIYTVADTMHARFSALSREYKYYICTRKDPFAQQTAYIYTLPLNMATMQAAADKLSDYTDFTSFAKLHTDTKTNNCRIIAARFEQKGDFLIFTIEADRFLRNMVRAIVGTLLEVGKGKLSVAEFCRIIEAKDRSAAKTSAAAQGLFLTNITYNNE